MRSVHLLRVLSMPLCLLVLISLPLVGCEGGDAASTMLTSSSPSVPALPQVQVPDVVGMGYGDAKKQLLETLLETFKEAQEKRLQLEKNIPEVEKILQKGADKVRKVTVATLEKVRIATGLKY